MSPRAAEAPGSNFPAVTHASRLGYHWHVCNRFHFNMAGALADGSAGAHYVDFPSEYAGYGPCCLR